eukprot:COSAG06_NODE_37175_length_438_cov_0.908555_2_plen_29_part_01
MVSVFSGGSYLFELNDMGRSLLMSLSDYN